MPVDRLNRFTLDQVRAAIEAPRVLNEEHAKPLGEPVAYAPLPGKAAAVLAALFEEDGEARVILTRRASHMRSHTHEVSFPGGRIEEGETAVEAALREAHEEIALDSSAIEIVGTLTPISTLAATSGITPIVGFLPTRPDLKANPDEVEFVFDVSLATLVSDGIFQEERWDTPWGDDRQINFFYLPHDIVWGATARVLRELLELVTNSQ
ncbi:MAG: CoA pyrophosphatase [Acidimicrobiales bacterium]|nr:CoA pyrophosphatase [Acidimicrobiales bacterium]